MDITDRFLNEPLTATVLRQLDFTPFTEEMIDRMESENNQQRLESVQVRQKCKKLEEEINKWQRLLPGCVDGLTGEVDRKR